MGLLKGGLMYVLSGLLILSLFAGNLFLVMNMSLTYENVNSHFSKLIREQTNIEQEIGNTFEAMENYCEENEDYVLEASGYTISIPCSKVAEGEEAVIEESINDVIDQIYYSENSCSSFFECIASSETAIFSQQTKDSMIKYFYISLIISLILAGAMFFITDSRIGFPITLGFLLILSSLPLVAVNFILPYFENSALSVVSALFSYSYTLFLILLFVGVISIALGFGLKFMIAGFKISKLFSGFKIKSKVSKSEDIGEK